jgi:hypothetical protein
MTVDQVRVVVDMQPELALDQADPRPTHSMTTSRVADLASRSGIE